MVMMTKNIAVTKGIDLDLLDTGQELDGILAWNIAEFINQADENVRLAKGKFWNLCEHGSRKEICDSFGWSYKSMQQYALFAKEIPFENGISYTHWDTVRKAGVSSTDRPKLLQKASDKGWTPKQLKESLKKKKKHKTTHITCDDIIAGEDDPDGPDINPAGKLGRPPTDTELGNKLTMSDACELLGLSTLTWITEETLNVLYRHYSKQDHPDKGGTQEAMDKLNKAKDKLKEIVR